MPSSSTPYTRNHTFPRAILDEHWASDDSVRGYRGCHVFDIDEGRTLFSSARGKRAFSFAIENNLYITDVGGSRATGSERWMGALDGRLVGFTRNAARTTESIYPGEDLLILLMALRTLNHRSPYVIQSLLRAVLENPELARRATAHSGRSAERIVIENIAHAVNEEARADILTWKYILRPAARQRFILSDRPFVAVGAHNVCVLAPTVAVAFEPLGYLDTQRWKTFELAEAPEPFVGQINRLVALNARKWLVAHDRATLDQVMPVVDSEDWRRYRDSERPKIRRPKWLTEGYSLRD